MRVAGVLAILGVASLVAAAVRGELQVHLFLIFPLVTGTGPFGVFGILLLMAAAVAAFFVPRRSLAWDAEPDRPHVQDVPREQPPATGAARGRSGGLLLLGPLPIVWGSDRGMAKGLILLAIVLAAIMLAIMLLPVLVR